jgi:lipoate-protein ligase A
MINGKFYATFNCEPYFNMAMDEWMFEQVLTTPGLIIVRLYTWSEGALTIGHNQNASLFVNGDNLKQWPVIRRVTGGRALHHDPSELTYSIAVNGLGLQSEKLNSSISRSSRNISIAIVEFLKKLGINAQYVRQSSPNFANANGKHSQECFESIGRYEIVGKNGKIVASAQRRIDSTFLQHGSIKINGVMTHPEFSGGDNNSMNSSAIQRITKSGFEEFSHLFQRILGDSLSIQLETTALYFEESVSIANRAKAVKKSRLEKRNLTKQITPSQSLSLETPNLLPVNQKSLD